MDELAEKEYQVVKIKALVLFFSPIMIHSMEDVYKIHDELFSELYIWAADYRKINISKQGKDFMAMQSFGTGEEYFDSLIEEYHGDSQTKEKIVSQLAIILDNLNYMHPFRERNGRTQCEVIRVLALAKG